MSNNPNLPQLFREILRNTYIPYRDPETLRRFLKEIKDFTYDDSEDLGNAFEYLLSIMGSQGDAGQFRTPRHIIDMMVEITAPRKDESILDPACGTAGFLISAYKYIQSQNKDEEGNSTLSPDDKKRLMENFAGYDISPDMVRLSRVNMYLHGFVNPNISEYDTLTSEEKWTDYYDVIFANPPFMTPKGGITPHSRYRVSAKRSEVLFVDYIAEHLNPNGRAAIIVPEGIVFQSQTAYKNLRQFLVDEGYLYGVISLPAGVFNPYSGVKTSILLIDKALAKQKDSILFVKLNNDGFDLGAQRREIKGSEIPDVVNIFKDYQKGISVEDRENVVIAKKKDIAGQDYILVGERYANAPTSNGVWPHVKMGEICKEMKAGFACGNSTKDIEGVLHIRPMNITPDGRFSLVGSKYIEREELREEYTIKAGDILFNNTNSKELVGKTCYISSILKAGFSNHITRIRVGDQVLPQFLAFVLQSMFESGVFLRMCNKWVGQAAINVRTLSEISIPLPPLTVQEEIVAEIEGYQKIIDGALQVVKNYKPTIKIDPKWEAQRIDTLCENLDSKRIPITSSDRKAGEIPYYGASGVVDYVQDYIFDEPLLLISEDGANLVARVTPIAFSISGKTWVNNHAHVLRFENFILQRYVEFFINQMNISLYITGAAQPKLTQENLNRIEIRVPSEEEMESIVHGLEAEIRIVEQNKHLIEIFQQKIKDRIAEVWGE